MIGFGSNQVVISYLIWSEISNICTALQNTLSTAYTFYSIHNKKQK